MGRDDFECIRSEGNVYSSVKLPTAALYCFYRTGLSILPAIWDKSPLPAQVVVLTRASCICLHSPFLCTRSSFLYDTGLKTRNPLIDASSRYYAGVARLCSTLPKIPVSMAGATANLRLTSMPRAPRPDGANSANTSQSLLLMDYTNGMSFVSILIRLDLLPDILANHIGRLPGSFRCCHSQW